MESTHDHLEHAEHARHAAHDPFERNVAMTMTVVAALLAVVTLLSHRAHTETLRLTTLAAVYKGKASDEWNYYQAKNIRRHLYETTAEVASVLAKEAGSSARLKTAQDRWKQQVDSYKEELPEQKKRAEELDKKSVESEEASELAHHKADRFDMGELGVEMALILSSIAMLSKRKSYWYGGIAFALAGVAIAASGFFA
jgi:Domain of unknown function (DUF4337)